MQAVVKRRARDDFGNTVASGVYFLKLTTGSDLFIRKAVFLK